MGGLARAVMAAWCGALGCAPHEGTRDPRPSPVGRHKAGGVGNCGGLAVAMRMRVLAPPPTCSPSPAPGGAAWAHRPLWAGRLLRDLGVGVFAGRRQALCGCRRDQEMSRPPQNHGLPRPRAPACVSTCACVCWESRTRPSPALCATVVGQGPCPFPGSDGEL